MSQSTYAYHPVPTGDEETLLPSGPLQSQARVRQTAYRTALGFLFTGLLALCILYVRNYTTLNQAGCVGLHSLNVSSEVEKLPSHYNLPSGDKIPSVGLGKYHRKHILGYWSILILIGVWRAGRNEVGEAVKVSIASHMCDLD